MRPLKEYLRGSAIVVYFTTLTLSLYFTMLLAYPLRFFSPVTWRAWRDVQKGHFGALLVSVQQLFASSKFSVYVEPQLRAKFVVDPENGTLHSRLAQRAVITSNHQIYSDWINIWWLAYVNDASGSVYIMLKRSLKYIPVVGWAMQNFGYLFLSRKWNEDRTEIDEKMKVIASDKQWPTWLVVFPEGTVVNKHTHSRSMAYAEKAGLVQYHPKNLLLPRVKGLQACLQSLEGTIKELYDFTIYYTGIPPGESGESHYRLAKVYLANEGPPEIRVHIRRFEVSEIPYDDDEKMTQWLYQRWMEKDRIYEQLATNSTGLEPLVTSPRLNSLSELYAAFNTPLTLLLLTRLMKKYRQWMGD